MSPGVAHAAVKAGHHLFHQYFISDHKGVYLHCDVRELFDVASIDKSHYSQRILTMQRRDTVEKYITKLEELYKKHQIPQRVEKLNKKLERAQTEEHRTPLFRRLNKLDWERSDFFTECSICTTWKSLRRLTTAP